MKRMFYLLVILCLSGSFTGKLFAQNSWKVNPYENRSFIENRGQFQIHPLTDFNREVKFAHDGHAENFYFTPSGVVIVLESQKKREKDEAEKAARKARRDQGFFSLADWQKFEKEGNRLDLKTEEVYCQWLGANPNAEIIAEEKNTYTHSYSYYDANRQLKDVSGLHSFKKLTYKNLYPGIDVVYEFHPEAGMKYSVIVHPGADASVVKLQYSRDIQLAADGTIRTATSLGEIIDHAPVTFYKGQNNQIIASSYRVENNTISFQLAPYNKNKTLIIDPWVQTPVFNTNWDCIWECETDAAGNSYIIGGVMPLQLIKYNNAGVQQWVYNTPYDTTSWLGTFATDDLGNSYVTNGSTAAIVKVNTAGTVVWNNPSPGGLLALTEFWNIAFNCDQTKLVIGGTEGTLNPIPYVFDINVNTGNVITSVQVTGEGALFGIPPNTNEVRAITATENDRYYFLTHDSIGYISSDLSLCPGDTDPFHVENGGYNFSYKNENWRYNNSGIEAMAYHDGFVYVNRGNRLDKRDVATAAIVQSVTIPGGGFSSSLGQNVVENSGIAIDECGNIFVGSKTGVYKFNTSLVQQQFFATTFNVYDVAVTSTGEVIAGGSTGTSSTSSRTGSIQSFAAATCAQQTTVCCDPTICPVDILCTNDAPYTILTGSAGGTWSVSPATAALNTSTGVFTPSAASPGTYTVTYTLPCGDESTTITVSNCTAMNLCKESNGSYTVSGGTAPFTWQNGTMVAPCISGFTFACGAFTAFGPPALTWTNFNTGTNVTPGAGIDTIQIIDNNGTTLTVFDLSTVPLCTACPTITASISNQINVLCFGQSNGSFSVSSSGGTGPYNYTLMNGATTVATFTNVAGAQAFTGLAAGTYTLNITDANGCPGTQSITITQPASAVNVSIPTSVQASCGSSNGSATANATGGTGAMTYSWNTTPVQNTATASGLSAGSYTVTASDANGCTATASISITSSGGPTPSIASQTNVLCFGGNTGSATATSSGGTGTITYSWNTTPVQNGATASGLTSGTYTVTATDANACASTVSVTITQPASAVSVSIPTTVPASCGSSNGSATANATGGTGAMTYSWNTTPVQNTATASGLSAGSYTVTASDANGCTATASTTITSSGGPTPSIASQTNVLCFGGNTGSATATSSGGTGTITYSWNTTPVQNGATASGLTAGTYTVTATDANACASTVSVTITQPASAVSVSIPTTVPASCGAADGSATANGTGGTGSISYSWNTTPVQNGATASGLAAGSYTVTASDANGCTATATTSISNNGGPSITIASQTNPNCNGDTDGSASVNVSGGTGTLNTSWNTTPVQAGTSANNLGAGTYTATVTDAAGCSASVVVTISQPTAITTSATSTPANCSAPDGTATANASGGTGILSYSWNSNPIQNTATASGLSSGSYTVTVTDANGCTDSATVNVGTISTANISAGADAYILQGDSTQLAATGGLVYVWTPATGLSCTNCATPYASPNTTQMYVVTGTDVNGCVGTDTVVVFVEGPCGELFVPNAFSPNGDNENDVLRIYGGCINELYFVVYDRWGEKVFETTNPSETWDGTIRDKQMNGAVFFYYLSASLTNGEIVERSGNITLFK